jgi:hypothetical protein
VWAWLGYNNNRANKQLLKPGSAATAPASRLKGMIDEELRADHKGQDTGERSVLSCSINALLQRR